MSSRPFSLPQLLLALIGLGMVGLLVELLLLGHYEEPAQFLPLSMLALGIVMAGLVWHRPSLRVVRYYRLLMAVYVVVGLLGVYFHLRGNLEFALERDPALTSVRLIWKILTGATPALAPGALAQLGLLGLLHAYHHPALHRTMDTISHDLHQEHTR